MTPVPRLGMIRSGYAASFNNWEFDRGEPDLRAQFDPLWEVNYVRYSPVELVLLRG